jgi:hypothetical protein
MKNFKMGLAYGFSAALAIAAVIAVLMVLNANGIIAQVAVKFGFILVFAFVMFGHVKRNNNRLNLPIALSAGAGLGVATFLSLVIIESFSMLVFDVKFAPASVLHADLAWFFLYVMFGFELLLYTLISTLIGFQYYKSPIKSYQENYELQTSNS